MIHHICKVSGDAKYDVKCSNAWDMVNTYITQYDSIAMKSV